MGCFQIVREDFAYDHYSRTHFTHKASKRISHTAYSEDFDRRNMFSSKED